MSHEIWKVCLGPKSEWNGILLVANCLSYGWISWQILPWELEGITSPCCLLIGQYPPSHDLCPPVTTVKRCYGIGLYG